MNKSCHLWSLSPKEETFTQAETGKCFSQEKKKIKKMIRRKGKRRQKKKKATLRASDHASSAGTCHPLHHALFDDGSLLLFLEGAPALPIVLAGPVLGIELMEPLLFAGVPVSSFLLPTRLS